MRMQKKIIRPGEPAEKKAAAGKLSYRILGQNSENLSCILYSNFSAAVFYLSDFLIFAEDSDSRGSPAAFAVSRPAPACAGRDRYCAQQPDRPADRIRLPQPAAHIRRWLSAEKRLPALHRLSSKPSSSVSDTWKPLEQSRHDGTVRYFSDRCHFPRKAAERAAP